MKKTFSGVHIQIAIYTISHEHGFYWKKDEERDEVRYVKSDNIKC